MSIKATVQATLLEVQEDTTADDSDKTFTVPTEERWHVFAIYVELTTTATVGNRQLLVDFRDDSNNVLARVVPGITQAASLTYNYSIAPGFAQQTSITGLTNEDNTLMTPMPPTMLLLPGYDIRIYDEATVDAAADDMTVRILIDRVRQVMTTI